MKRAPAVQTIRFAPQTDLVEAERVAAAVNAVNQAWAAVMTLPSIVSPVLKANKKIVLGAANSNIAEGAMLVVDGQESFLLKPNGNGKKWVVGATTRSTPGDKTVANIWSDGNAHMVVVRNPDGTESDPVSLGGR